MRKRTDRNYGDKKLLSVEEACSRYSIGENTMRNLAKKMQAAVRIGRLVRINADVMDEYFDSLTQ